MQGRVCGTYVGIGPYHLPIHIKKKPTGGFELATPFVRQYGILSNKWGVFYAKRSTKQTIYAGIQKR